MATAAAANINRAAGAANPLARDSTFIEHGHWSLSPAPTRDDESDYDLHFSNSDSHSRSCTRIMAQHRRDEAGATPKGYHPGHYPVRKKSPLVLREGDRAQTVPTRQKQQRKYHTARSVGNFADDDELTDHEDDADDDSDLAGADMNVRMAPASPMLDADVVAGARHAKSAAGRSSKSATVRRLDFDGAATTADADSSSAMVMATPDVGPRDSPHHHHSHHHHDGDADGAAVFDFPMMAPLPPVSPADGSRRSPSPIHTHMQQHPQHVQTHHDSHHTYGHGVDYPYHYHNEQHVHFPNNSGMPHERYSHTHAATAVEDWPPRGDGGAMSPLSDLSSVLGCATSRYGNEPLAHPRYHHEQQAAEASSLLSRALSRGGGPPPLIDDNASSFYESEFRQMASQHRRMYADLVEEDVERREEEYGVCVGNPGHGMSHGGIHTALDVGDNSDTYRFEPRVQNENSPPPAAAVSRSKVFSTPPRHAPQQQQQQQDKRRPLRRSSSKKQRSGASSGKHKRKGSKARKHRRGAPKSSHTPRKRRAPLAPKDDQEQEQENYESVAIAIDVAEQQKGHAHSPSAMAGTERHLSKNSSPPPPPPQASLRGSSTGGRSARKSWWKKLFHRVLCVGVMCPSPNDAENYPPPPSPNTSAYVASSPTKSVHTAHVSTQTPPSSHYAPFTPPRNGSLIYSSPSRPFTPSYDAGASRASFVAPVTPNLSHHRRRRNSNSSLSQLKPFPGDKLSRFASHDLQQQQQHQQASYAAPRPLTPEHESRSVYTYGEHHIAFDTPQKLPTYSPPPLLRPTPIHARVRSHPAAAAAATMRDATPERGSSPVARIFTHDVSHMSHPHTHTRTRTPEPLQGTSPLAELPSPIRQSEPDPMMSDFPEQLVPALSDCGSDLPLPLAYQLVSPVVHFRTPAVVRVGGGPSVATLHDARGSMTAPRPIRPTPIRPKAIVFESFAMSDTEPESAGEEEDGSMVSDLEHYVETHPGGFDCESAGPTPNMPTRGGGGHVEAAAGTSHDLREIDAFLGGLMPPAAPSFGSIDMLDVTVGNVSAGADAGLAPPAAPHWVSRVGMRTPPHMAVRAITPPPREREREEFVGAFSALDTTLLEFDECEVADADTERTSPPRTHRLPSDRTEDGSEPKRHKYEHLGADEVPATVSRSAPPARGEVLDEVLG